MAQLTVPRQIRGVVAMKPETAAGTDVFAGTYVAGDVLPIIVDSLRFTQDPNEIENLMTAGNLGRAPSILGPLTARVDFGMFLRGKNAPYSVTVTPEAGLPLRGCGLAQTVDTTAGVEKVTYQPSATEETMTLYVVLDVPGGSALSIQLVGCLGTVSMSARAGGAMRADFSFVGAIDERADIPYVGGTLAPTPAFPTLKSAAFQIGAANYAPRIANVGFALGNVVRAVESINAASGVAGFKIMDRNPRFTFDPEADREANSGWWTALSTGAPLKDMTFQLGTAQYNRLIFQVAAGGVASQGQIVAQSLGSRDGLFTLPTTVLATISAGNDDLALVFS